MYSLQNQEVVDSSNSNGKKLHQFHVLLGRDCAMWRTLAILLGLLALSGCSTYSKRQCEEMNWEQAGMSSALAGGTLQSARYHYDEKCQKEHGIAVDEVQLKSGWKTGNQQFCTVDGGIKAGHEIVKYEGVCDSQSEAAFLKSYVPAYTQAIEAKLSQLKSENSRLESHNSSLEGEVSSLKRENSRLRSQVSSCH